MTRRTKIQTCGDAMEIRGLVMRTTMGVSGIS